MKRQEFIYSTFIYPEAAVECFLELPQRKAVRLGKGRGKSSEQSGKVVHLKVVRGPLDRIDRIDEFSKD